MVTDSSLPTSFTTRRCLVRRAEARDAQTLFDATRTTGFNQWLSWDPPADVSIIADRFRQQQREWDEGREFAFTALSLETSNIVGGVDLKPDPFEPREAEFNLGYWTHPSYQRQGYAGEFVAGVTAWAFQALGAKRLVAAVGVDNDPSHRLLRTLGFAVFDRKSICSPSKSFDNVRYQLLPAAR